MGKKENSLESLRFVNALMPRLLFTATPNIPHTETNGNPIHLAIINAGSFVTGSFLAGDFETEHRRQAERVNAEMVKPPARGNARLSTLSRTEDYVQVGEHSILSDVGDGQEVSVFETVVEADNENNHLFASSSMPLNLEDEANADETQRSNYARFSQPYASLRKSRDSRAIHAEGRLLSSSYPGDMENDNVGATSSELQAKLRNVLERLEVLHHKNEELQTRVREREISMQNMKSVIGNLQAEISEYKKTVVDLRQQGDSVDSKNKKKGKQCGKDGSSLDQENADLKLVIEKLNTELFHYQQKFRTALPNDDNGMPPLSAGNPPWLTSTKYLSPLILAFDDRLNEKEVEVRDLERQVMHLKEAMDEVLRENQLLNVSNSMPNDSSEWERVKEQAKLVLDENQILIEQLNVERNKTRQQLEVHKSEIARLTRKLVATEADKAYYESEFQELNEKFLVLKKRLEPEGATEFIALKTHITELEACEKKLTDFKNQAKVDFEALLQLENSELEIKKLKEEKVSGREELDSLRSRVETIVRAQKKWQEKAVLLEKKLLYAEEREQKLNEQLSVALDAAEQAVEYRDFYLHEIRLILDGKNETIADLNSKQLSEVEVEEQLRNYRSLMKQKVKRIAEAHVAKKKEFEEKENNYLSELESLRKCLADERLRNEELSRS